ncbi:MAG: hypothetical protein A3F78_02010 [Burkholderiales bacterium RIFCSPLOWO2_12_FULL_61_40]|nr:MAG: hypothetical protein A3F78_02010 [Burkholderiales bacterium RIFCSPLOWO2_12_FULL_61_40]
MLTQRATVFLVAVLALWRLYLSAGLQLHPDEAYYWWWSRHLDTGYFDHPPMVAYFIWISTFFSSSELWVRLSGTVVLLLMSGLMWRLAMQLFQSERVAAGSVILFNSSPLIQLGMVVITPDVPLLLFCALSICLFWQTLHSQRTWLWYALGGAFGMALLSKYTAILLIPCFLLYLLLTEDRRWLKTVYPYLAALVALVCFLPVVVWNSRNAWVSFLFQLKNCVGGEGFALSKVAEYFAGQMLVTGPLVWLLGMYAAMVGVCRKDKATLLLVCTAAPVILFFGVTSFIKVAYPNWPALAYFSLSILVSQHCLGGDSKMPKTPKVRRVLWSAAVVSTLALSLIATVHARFSFLPLGRYAPQWAAADATNAFYGWRELGAELKSKFPNGFAITPSHQLSAEIIYYTGASVLAQPAKTARPSQFNLLHLPYDPWGKGWLHVWTDADGADFGPSSLAPGHHKHFDVYREGRVVRSYFID